MKVASDFRMLRIYYICIFLLIPGSFAYGQQDSTKHRLLHPMLEAGVMTGGEVSNGVFLYRNAKLAELSLNIRSGEKIYYGIGSGVEVFRDDHFIPLFIQFKGMSSRKSSSSFISVQAGYGFTSSVKTYSLQNVKTKGGLFFSPGIGYKLKVERKLILLSVNYKHQFTRLEYTGVSTEVYDHEANLHLLSFKAGLLLD